MNPLKVNLNDFTRLIDENKKRVFYYETESLIELYFFMDTVPVKTIVEKQSIDDIETFRGHKMFYGSISLTSPLFKEEKSIFDILEDREGGSELGLMKENKPNEEQRQDSEENIKVKETPTGDIVK